MRHYITALQDSDFAAMLEVEGLPGGTTRAQYVQQACDSILDTQINWQFDNLR